MSYHEANLLLSLAILCFMCTALAMRWGFYAWLPVQANERLPSHANVSLADLLQLFVVYFFIQIVHFMNFKFKAYV